MRTTEYDLDLTYQVASKSAPACLKPLQLRARAAYVDDFTAGGMTATTEYRLILNYEWTFKDGR